ncbi:MAG: GIY-YIG nuclease family protein [bacterium]
MYYTYLIISQKKKWIYIGSTRDLKKRFLEHNRGEVKSTKFYSPFDLLYYEAYREYRLARKRELELKNKGQQKECLFRRLDIQGGVA